MIKQHFKLLRFCNIVFIPHGEWCDSYCCAEDDLILDELEPKIYYKYIDKESGPPYYTKVDEYYLVTPEQYHRCIEQKPVETVQDVSFEEVKDSGPTNADILEAIGGLAKTLDKLM